jgi:hypothetical protein
MLRHTLSITASSMFEGTDEEKKRVNKVKKPILRTKKDRALLVLRIKFIRRPSFVAIAHRDAPPTDITQERIERRELVFDAVTCKHVKILEEHRNYFLRAQE